MGASKRPSTSPSRPAAVGRFERRTQRLSAINLAASNAEALGSMDGGQMIGLVSIGDLVKATISEQQFIIDQLEHYISGQRD